MAQLDPSRYKRLTQPMTYASSDGLYWDGDNSRMISSINGIAYEIPMQLSGQSSGEFPVRGASTWDAVPLSGDGTLSSAGVLTLGVTQVKYVKVAVSSAELLAINAAPKTIVAAPGAGFTTILHNALLVLNYNSVAYANNGILGLYETNASGTLLTGTLTLASFLDQTADTQKELHPSAASATTGLTRGDNKAVVLTQATGESISGDSPVDVHCWYSTVPNGL